MAHVERRPVLVFDGDCAFCSSCARLLQQICPEVEVAAWQASDLDELGISVAEAMEAVRWIGPGGAIRAGHEAIAAALATAGWPWWILGRAILLPGLSPLAAWSYRAVARNRHRLPGGAPACASGRDARA
jgi:predicted DCC family thiol-disulfide oxidoreductase YuxK